ncbi:hypothetical protein SKAU_G00356280 [Synaphobranchus kaupii]|uniref:Uncharacterized protein n=1 Tax=Synaphobranchus kaupii TaxID=118154 RepID=A0A9Q1EHH1_SYNKA|nr:hypothetical protein SKAU_G00356280 [Synaphobranchus kaupii]
MPFPQHVLSPFCPFHSLSYLGHFKLRRLSAFRSILGAWFHPSSVQEVCPEPWDGALHFDPFPQPGAAELPTATETIMAVGKLNTCYASRTEGEDGGGTTRLCARVPAVSKKGKSATRPPAQSMLGKGQRPRGL